MKVGIKQVAERAGVSATTVSHVVNKTRYVSPEVEKRVNDAIDELGYVPNIMARGLRTNTIKTVAVIVQEASTPFFSRVVDEISNVLYEEDYSLFLCMTRSQADDELNVFRSMLQQQVCGIILSPQQMDFDYRSLCPSKDFPIVFIDRRTNDIQGNTVTCDNYRVSYDAVKALVGKGHTQIGYIYMGFGLGTSAGMVASIFHILSHAATKSLLFVSGVGLTDVSGGHKEFVELTGSGYRNVAAGIAFMVGSLSMVGIPAFSGFISKLLFAQAAVQNHTKMLPALIVLGVSTILNAIYFMKTVIRIYTPVGYSAYPSITLAKMRIYAVTLAAFILLNVILGVSSQPVVDMIRQGLTMFS